MSYKCSDCFYFTSDSRCRLIDEHRDKDKNSCVAFGNKDDYPRKEQPMKRQIFKCSACGKDMERYIMRENSKCPACQRKADAERRKELQIQHDNEIKRLAYGELADYLIHCTSLDNNLIELGLDEMLNRLSER